VGSVAFLRAVNVAGRTVSVTDLARRLGPLGARSIGAAGTFVLTARAGPSSVADTISRALGFPTPVVVVPAREVAALLASDPFRGEGRVPGAKRYVTVLAGAPTRAPALPIDRPEGAGWEVRVTERRGPFVLSLWRLVGERRRFYANAVVEAAYGVAATTRGWETIERVGRALSEEERPGKIARGRPPVSPPRREGSPRGQR